MYILPAVKKLVRFDNSEQTVQAFTAKVAAGWAGWFAGLSLGDIATLTVICWTGLNIIFLLYDRLIKPFKKKKDLPSDSGKE